MSDIGEAMTDSGKTVIGLSGVMAWFTLSEWSLIAGIAAAVATFLWMMLQVAHRFREIYLEKRKNKYLGELGK